MPWNKFWVLFDKFFLSFKSLGFFDKFFLSFKILGFVCFCRVKRKWNAWKHLVTIFSLAMFTDPICLCSCDDFFVDELLDLPNEDGFVKEEEEVKDKSFVFDHENSNIKTTTFTASKDEFGSVPTSELGRDKGGVR